VNIWRPEAGIDFAKVGAKRTSEDPTTKERPVDCRINEVRRLLAEHRDDVARRGRHASCATSKAVEMNDASRGKTAGERKRRSPDADSSAPKRRKIGNRPSHR
jgi:hypothetical protein